MNKPVIGIPSKMRQHDEKDLWHRQEVVDDLRYLIVRHGGICIMLTPSELTMKFNESDLGDDTVLSEEEISDLHRQVDLCDGIILQGGDYSCAFEVEIARYALEKDIPLLGICAGFNNFLRALGSNIYEDETKRHSVYDKDYRHEITVEKDTLLYEIIQSDTYQVNTFHTMIADDDRVRPYAQICAHSYDGLVESFALPDKRFALAVKWHPELMKDEACCERLFDRFIDACKEGKED